LVYNQHIALLFVRLQPGQDALRRQNETFTSCLGLEIITSADEEAVEFMIASGDFQTLEIWLSR